MKCLISPNPPQHYLSASGAGRAKLSVQVLSTGAGGAGSDAPTLLPEDASLLPPPQLTTVSSWGRGY